MIYKAHYAVLIVRRGIIRKSSHKQDTCVKRTDEWQRRNVCQQNVTSRHMFLHVYVLTWWKVTSRRRRVSLTRLYEYHLMMSSQTDPAAKRPFGLRLNFRQRARLSTWPGTRPAHQRTPAARSRSGRSADLVTSHAIWSVRIAGITRHSRHEVRTSATPADHPNTDCILW